MKGLNIPIEKKIVDYFIMFIVDVAASPDHSYIIVYHKKSI